MPMGEYFFAFLLQLTSHAYISYFKRPIDVFGLLFTSQSPRRRDDMLARDDARILMLFGRVRELSAARHHAHYWAERCLFISRSP